MEPRDVTQKRARATHASVSAARDAAEALLLKGNAVDAVVAGVAAAAALEPSVLLGPVQASGSLSEPPTRLTVTRKAQVWLPMLLEQVTVVTPTLKLEPDGGVQVIVPQLPFGVGGE